MLLLKYRDRYGGSSRGPRPAAVRVLRSGYSSVLPCTSVACAELLGSGLPAPVVPVPPCLPVLRLLPRRRISGG